MELTIRPHYLRTHPPTSPSRVLGLKTCATISGILVVFITWRRAWDFILFGVLVGTWTCETGVLQLHLLILQDQGLTLVLAGLELMVFLHQPSKCWVYACEPLLSLLSMESINFSSFLSTALHFICLLSFSFCLQRLYSHRLGKRYRCEGEELLSLRDGKVCFSPIQKNTIVSGWIW